jgi:hypothetical protein
MRSRQLNDVENWGQKISRWFRNVAMLALTLAFSCLNSDRLSQARSVMRWVGGTPYLYQGRNTDLLQHSMIFAIERFGYLEANSCATVSRRDENNDLGLLFEFWNRKHSSFSSIALWSFSMASLGIISFWEIFFQASSSSTFTKSNEKRNFRGVIEEVAIWWPFRVSESSHKVSVIWKVVNPWQTADKQTNLWLYYIFHFVFSRSKAELLRLKKFLLFESFWIPICNIDIILVGYEISYAFVCRFDSEFYNFFPGYHFCATYTFWLA